MRYAALGLALLAAACRPAFAPRHGLAEPAETTRAVRALAALATRGTAAFELVRALTIEAGPRPVGSAGDAAGVRWAERTLRAAGFAVRVEPFEAKTFVRGIEKAEILAPHPQRLVVTALGGGAPTPDEGLSAEVIRAEDNDALAKLPDERVRGRIVFLDKKMRRAKDGAGYGETVPIRSRGPSVASKKGALAVLIRSVSTASHRLPHTGGTWWRDGAKPIPAGALSVPDADLLRAMLDGGAPVRVHLVLTSREGPVGKSANVIAELPGREPRAGVVLLGAHHDSWDLGTGALDDAAGCAIVIEAARRIAALPRRPRRTLRVVLFGAEETGLNGAFAYAKSHATELRRHAIAVEADLGTGAVYALKTRVAPTARPFFDALAATLSPLGIALGGNAAHGGADLIPLGEKGVPIASLSQDASTYFDFHHTANDTLDKIDRRALDQATAAFAAFAYAAADTTLRFTPAPPPPK